MAHLRLAEAVRPEDVDTHRGLVAMLAQRGEVAEAIREQRVVVDLAAKDAAEWNNLGALEARAGDKTAAEREFRKALGLDPGNTEARANLARL